MVIVQRPLEVGSRLQRVRAPIELRAGTRREELRRFHIDDSGIAVGEALPRDPGLPSARPERIAGH